MPAGLGAISEVRAGGGLRAQAEARENKREE